MSTASRDDRFRLLRAIHFDLLVIGGGATGCGVARDAALRGFSVALVDKGDIGGGTSSKSSKLVHGGLRYLEHAQFKLVFEGTNERALLLKRAPHLVRPLPFLVPAYKESRHGRLALDVGLWLYDALSGFSSPQLHRTYKTRGLVEIEPGLRAEQLMGGAVYYDCSTDDARLTLENALDARALGAVVLPYARAQALLRDPDGHVTGAEVSDAEPGAAPRSVTVRARVTVNATGPWSDEVRALLGEPPVLRPTKGVHLVLDRQRLGPRHAVVMLARADHRAIFAIPWEDRTVLGTTDTDFAGDPDAVCATAEDAAYLLETANHYFPGAALGPDDVLATWAGLRPLLSPARPERESDVSREHQLLERPGLVTIAGGKLTTYRRMAIEVVDRAGAQIGKIPAATTADRPLPGARGVDGQAGVLALSEGLAAHGLEAQVARHLAITYGSRGPLVAARAATDETAGHRIEPELPFLWGEVDEAVEQELAVTLVDVLERRVPLLLRSRDQGLAVAPRVAERLSRRLGWSALRRADELQRYQAQVELSRRFRSR